VIETRAARALIAITYSNETPFSTKKATLPIDSCLSLKNCCPIQWVQLYCFNAAWSSHYDFPPTSSTPQVALQFIIMGIQRVTPRPKIFSFFEACTFLIVTGYDSRKCLPFKLHQLSITPNELRHILPNAPQTNFELASLIHITSFRPNASHGWLTISK